MGRKRILFFLGINIVVLLSLSILLSIFGVKHYITPMGNYESLLIICLVFGMGSAFISLFISKWVAKKFMGVQIVKPGTSGEEGELLQRVHNLAKAASLPKMPELGIYQSPEISAFATGHSRKNSLLAVSTGLLHNLLHNMNQDEVERVLAHEVSQIANGDMLSMTLVQGAVNAFVMFLARF